MTCKWRRCNNTARDYGYCTYHIYEIWKENIIEGECKNEKDYIFYSDIIRLVNTAV